MVNPRFFWFFFLGGKAGGREIWNTGVVDPREIIMEHRDQSPFFSSVVRRESGRL